MSLAGGGAAPRRLPIPKPVRGTVQYGPPGSTFHPDQASSGGSLADVIAQAKSVANQQVQAQVQAIQAQQHIATQQAAARAAQINQASQAAAAYLQKTGLAGNLQQQDYQQAVNNMTGLASGFSGQLKQDAQAQADQAQQMLGSVAGNTQQLENKGEPLGQLLFGLGANIPGRALNTQGLGAVTAARALPAATLGYGQQQGIAALQSGQGQAASLEGQIAQAQAQRPSITSNLIGQFTSAYNTAQSNALNTAALQSEIAARDAATRNANTTTRLAVKKYNAGVLAASGIDSAASARLGVLVDHNGQYIPDKSGYQQAAPGWQFDANGHAVKSDPPTTPAQKSQLAKGWTAVNGFVSNWDGTPKGGVYTPIKGYHDNPNGIGVVANTTKGSSAAVTPHNIGGFTGWIGPDGKVHYSLDPVTHARIPWQGGSGGSSGGALSDTKIGSLVHDWIQGDQSGTQSVTATDKTAGTSTTNSTPTYSGGKDYQDMLTLARSYPPATARKIINQINAQVHQGENGRPYSDRGQAAAAALQHAQAAAQHGVPMQREISHIMNSGYFPPPMRQLVLNAVYRAYHVDPGAAGTVTASDNTGTRVSRTPKKPTGVKGYRTPTTGPKKDIPQYPAVSGPQIPLP